MVKAKLPPGPLWTHARPRGANLSMRTSSCAAVPLVKPHITNPHTPVQVRTRQVPTCTPFRVSGNIMGKQSAQLPRGGPEATLGVFDCVHKQTQTVNQRPGGRHLLCLHSTITDTGQGKDTTWAPCEPLRVVTGPGCETPTRTQTADKDRPGPCSRCTCT